MLACGGSDNCNARGPSADLRGCDLTGAYLSSSNLEGANLSGADLTGAFLIRANLTNANLSGADLTGADLAETNLTSANLTGADLSGALWSNTARWFNTTCPNGTVQSTPCQ